MKQIFEKRYTKIGVRSFKVNDKGREYILVFHDFQSRDSVFQGISTFEEQMRLAYRLSLRGIDVEMHLFDSNISSQEDVLRAMGFEHFEEVIV